MNNEDREEIIFDLRYGHVCLATKQPVTFDSLTQLAQAAQIMGVPADSKIGGIRLEQRHNGSGVEYEVSIDWRREA